MKNFDFDNEMPELDPSRCARLLSRVREKFTFRKKEQPIEPGPEQKLNEQESVELKEMIDSLTEPVPSLKRPVIIEDPLPIPTPAPQRKSPLARFGNVIVAVLAFLAGAYGVMVLYNQLPTYPMLVVGIVAIAASSGVITGITARG